MTRAERPSPAIVVARTVALAVAGLVLLLFTAAVLLSQIFAAISAASAFSPVWRTVGALGARVTGTAPAPVDVATGSDLAWAWQFHAGALVIGIAVGLVWGVLAVRGDDRGRAGIERAGRVLRAAAIGVLAVAMLLYGLAKVIPAQMGYMNLPAYQLQAVGDTEPFSLLWGYMAASTPYTVITGAIELTAGLLLIVPRTRLVGAMLSIAALTQIVLLNVFYDVPVKLLAAELLVIAVVLVFPHRRELLRAVLPTAASPARRTGTVVAGVLAAVLIAATVSGNLARVDTMNTPRDPRDGVWRAVSLTVDGAPALATGEAGPVWTSIAITLRGTADRPASGSAQDSLVTQAPDGAVTAWGLRVRGDRFTVRRGASAAPVDLLVTTVPGGLRMVGTVDGRSLDARYERRALERRDDIRLVQAPFDRTRPRL
ncbi:MULTISPECIES: hypothetical protein [Tsukamurella]|uniref:DoxX family protein n=2 Tax=Tsukamurella TaxID=2060 RepID=A0A138AID7_9ACTN|nr:MULTISPECIES: hypothetical protein [Tsukamurella]KXO98567.1 hypothetical protein AXK61_02980 [Tsukamurella pseudospumae]KXP10119.1 hypothetical protein AXK60_06425 [Tsukamurella pseudospumae]NKY18484.1 hypothetical protein [Tsukamurella spumae]